jgi:uncharacterized membrane protein YedE/YeeE
MVAGATGALFGAGLVVSGMADPTKVLAFLDVAGAWDPSLLFVMGGGLVVTFIGFHWVLKREQPILDDVFHLPTKRDLDPRLLAGSAMFGIGWGIAGYCPGPAFAAITINPTEALICVLALAVGSMLAGMTEGP